ACAPAPGSPRIIRFSNSVRPARSVSFRLFGLVAMQYVYSRASAKSIRRWCHDARHKVGRIVFREPRILYSETPARRLSLIPRAAAPIRVSSKGSADLLFKVRGYLLGRLQLRSSWRSGPLRQQE